MLAPEDCVAAGHWRIARAAGIDLEEAVMDLRAALSYCPIVAILRGVKPDEIDGIGDALIEAGVTVIEVPLNSPQPFESIAPARRASRAPCADRRRHGARSAQTWRA